MITKTWPTVVDDDDDNSFYEKAQDDVEEMESEEVENSSVGNMALRKVGTQYKDISESDIYDFIIPLPTQKELSKFDSMVVPMFDKIQQNEHEIRCLTNLRDALLLKLMNGELKAYLVR